MSAIIGLFGGRNRKTYQLMTAIQRRKLIKNEIVSERVSYKKKVNIFDIVSVVNGKGTKHKKHCCDVVN